jgi:D-ribose pyranase
MDTMMVVDAGFPCPDEVELIDIALTEGVPTVQDVLSELSKHHSVEKIVMAEDTRAHNPSHFETVSHAFGEGIEVEVIPHTELKQRSHHVKTIIRTGDFTAWGNVLLVSGAGDRWQMEQ